MLGDSGVGKSSFIHQFVHHSFVYQPLTIGIDYASKVKYIDGKLIKFTIWDTAGQEKYQSIITSYVRDVHGSIILYDITDIDSFRAVSSWIDIIREMNPVDTPIIIVGNKTDLDVGRVVSFSEGEKLANILKVEFMEASSKQLATVDGVYNSLSTLITNYGTRCAVCFNKLPENTTTNKQCCKI